MNNNNNSEENMKGEITPNQDNEDLEQELSSKLNKKLSPTRGILRIVLGFLAFLIWILIGVSPTIIFTSSLQGFIGVFSVLVRNPIIFLLIALLNIILGITYYLLFQILWWSLFHFVWSIRWFYGFVKYSKLKNYSYNESEG
jgi:hypothetical protein